MSEPRMYQSGGLYLFGIRLGPGDVLQEGDMYSSSSGGWQKCPCPGLTLQAGDKPDSVLWVRPGFEK